MVRFIYAILAVICVSVQANAAIVGNIQGTVQIGAGPDAVLISTPTNIDVGSVILTGPNGSATIYFENGCSAVLQGNQSFSIPASPQCQKNDQSSGNNTTTALAVGGLVVVAGAGAALALGGGGGSSKSASP